MWPLRYKHNTLITYCDHHFVSCWCVSLCVCFAGSCHQDNCVFAPLLDSQASSSSGGDRHAPVNPAIGSSASWSSSLANSFPSGGTETDTDQLSGEFANSTCDSSWSTAPVCWAFRCTRNVSHFGWFADSAVLWFNQLANHWALCAVAVGYQINTVMLCCADHAGKRESSHTQWNSLLWTLTTASSAVLLAAKPSGVI